MSVTFRFLKKFISRSHSQRGMADKSIPVEIVSPNHPERYTKRQVRRERQRERERERERERGGPGGEQKRGY